MTYEEAKEIYKKYIRGSRGHRKWPDSYSVGDCDFLSVFYLEISDEDLAFILGRSEKSIIVKRLSLGLCRPRGYEIPPLEGEKKIIEEPEPEKPVEKASFRDECRAKGMSYAEMQTEERLMQVKKDLSLREFNERQNIKRSNIKPIWADGIFKKQEGKMGTAKEGLLSSYDYLLETAKICLAIKMPDGNTGLIINQNAKAKIDHIRNAYDDDLKLKNNSEIQIVSYMFYE